MSPMEVVPRELVPEDGPVHHLLVMRGRYRQDALTGLRAIADSACYLEGTTIPRYYFIGDGDHHAILDHRDLDLHGLEGSPPVARGAAIVGRAIDLHPPLDSEGYPLDDFFNEAATTEIGVASDPR